MVSRAMKQTHTSDEQGRRMWEKGRGKNGETGNEIKPKKVT